MTAQVKRRPRLGIKSLPKVPPAFILSKAELAALALTVAILAVVIGYYFTSLAPLQSQLATVENEMALQTDILRATTDSSRKPSSKEMLKKAKESLAGFEGEWLKPYDQGRIDAINEINSLVKSNDVHLTSGISLHSVSSANLKAAKNGSNRKRGSGQLDVYPRVQMSFSVFGQYPQLRKLIKELQASKQFLVIDSVAISPVEERQGRGARAREPSGSGLALTVLLNVYFHP